MVSKKDLKRAFDAETERQGELNADILERLEIMSQKFTSFDERLSKLEGVNAVSNTVNLYLRMCAIKNHAVGFSLSFSYLNFVRTF